MGKTEVVKQVADVLGYECVRINFSANTTLGKVIFYNFFILFVNQAM